jgi:hypothetical protein
VVLFGRDNLRFAGGWEFPLHPVTLSCFCRRA